MYVCKYTCIYTFLHSSANSLELFKFLINLSFSCNHCKLDFIYFIQNHPLSLHKLFNISFLFICFIIFYKPF